MSAPSPEQPAAPTIESACRTLRLPTVREVAAPLAEARFPRFKRLDGPR